MAQLLQNGDQIDKYRVERCLGAGGMGEVYLVSHTYLNVQRAMKILRMDLTEDDPTFRDRFVREARIAAQFQHPNSIGVVDVESSSESGFLYLVMEYVDGCSLHQFLQNGGLEEEQMLHVCREVAKALDAAWKQMKLVHRDIKPGNIMISNTGEVKLADLGIAKSSGGSGMTMALTMEGTMIGTPEYASPEQCRDASTVDTRADIYSLGATMYEMLTGFRPFQGANAFDTVAKVLQEPLVPVRERNRNISEETAALIERMMAKDPADRPQSMEALISLIDNIMQEQEHGYRLAALIPPEQEAEREKKIRAQVEELADEIVTQQVNSVYKKQKTRHLVSSLIALFLVVLDIYLGWRYVDKTLFYDSYDYSVTSMPVQMKKTEESPELNKIRKIQNAEAIRISADGKNLYECVLADQNRLHIPQSVMSIAPDLFKNCQNLEDLRFYLHQAEQIRPYVSGFDKRLRVFVYVPARGHYDSMDFFNNVSVSYVRTYSYQLPETETEKMASETTRKTAESTGIPAEKIQSSTRVQVPSARAADIPPQRLPVADTGLRKKVFKGPPLKIVKSQSLYIPPDVTDIDPSVFQKYKSIRVLHIPGHLFPVIAAKISAFEDLNVIRVNLMPGQMISPIDVPAHIQCVAFFSPVTAKPSRPAPVSAPTSTTLSAQKTPNSTAPKTLLTRLFDETHKKVQESKAEEKGESVDHLQSAEYKEARDAGMEFSPDGRTLRRFAPRRDMEVCRVPEGVEKIDNRAFMNNNHLRKVFLPSTLKNISIYAFAYCRNLQTVKLPDGLKVIDYCAFYYCRNLKELPLPSGLEKIGFNAFSYTGLKSITIPASVRQINFPIFSAGNQVKIIVSAENPSYSQDRYGAIYSSDGETLYSAPKNNSRFSFGSYTVKEGTKKIYRYAFSGSRLHQVQLPRSLETISQWAFNLCNNLELVIPVNVKTIEESALKGLKSVDLEKGNRYFYRDSVGALYCGKDRRLVYFPRKTKMPVYRYKVLKGAKVIDRYVFSANNNVQEILLPSTIEEIKDFSFVNCRNLMKVEIDPAADLKYIGYYAFKNCPNLKKIWVPPTARIHTNAFDAHVKVSRRQR
ncbi:MAG: leucine-rich repeat protein [Lentisphaeria bacterium]|nr:leucine-rich repeat protein [Lentisphaeria bacterium]